MNLDIQTMWKSVHCITCNYEHAAIQDDNIHAWPELFEKISTIRQLCKALNNKASTLIEVDRFFRTIDVRSTLCENIVELNLSEREFTCL